VFFKKNKEKKINTLTESDIRKKLYGHLDENEQEKKKKGLKDFEEKARVAEKEQIKEEAKERIETLEKKLASTKHLLQAAGRKTNQFKNEVLSKKEKCAFKEAPIKPILIIIALIAVTWISVSIFKGKGRVSSNPTEPPAAKQTEASVLSYKSFYTIQICIYEKEKAARQLVEKLKKKKIDAYIYPHKSKNKTNYRVYVGRFSSEKNALKTFKNLKKTFDDSFIRVVKQSGKN